jgi:hypothetical protein
MKTHRLTSLVVSSALAVSMFAGSAMAGSSRALPVGDDMSGPNIQSIYGKRTLKDTILESKWWNRQADLAKQAPQTKGAVLKDVGKPSANRP